MSSKRNAADIVLTPDPRLAQVCAPIERIDDHIRALAQRMLEAMYAAEGCGLAAPQMGELVRMFVIDVDYAEDDGEPNPYVLINPEILVADGDPRSFKEGCLSFPGITVELDRPSHVIVQATDLDGDLLQYEAEGNLMAVCLQHEMDHLNGVTMVDHLPPLRRERALRKCRQAIAEGAVPGDTARD